MKLNSPLGFSEPTHQKEPGASRTIHQEADLVHILKAGTDDSRNKTSQDEKKAL